MDTSAQLSALVLVGQPKDHFWDLILAPYFGFFFTLAGHNLVPSKCFHLVTSFNSKMQQSFYRKVCKVLWTKRAVSTCFATEWSSSQTQNSCALMLLAR